MGIRTKEHVCTKYNHAVMWDENQRAEIQLNTWSRGRTGAGLECPQDPEGPRAPGDDGLPSKLLFSQPDGDVVRGLLPQG